MQEHKIQVNEDAEDLILKYVNEGASDAEADALKDWLKKDEDHCRLYAELAAVSADASMLSLESQARTEALEQSVKEKIRRTKLRKRRIVCGIFSGLAVAAAVALFFWIWPAPQTDVVDVEPTVRYISYQNTTGDVNAIVLEDGSKVWLRRGSSILYSEQDGNRIAELDGAAYFKVERDTLHPFVVQTEGIDVKVLGTSFSVTEAPESTVIVLESGAVSLMTKDGHKLLKMLPDQKAVFEGDELTVEALTAQSYLYENFNMVSLNGVTVGDILAHVEAIYNIKLRPVGRYDKTKLYNLNYSRTDSIDILINTISTLTGTQLTPSN